MYEIDYVKNYINARINCWYNRRTFVWNWLKLKLRKTITFYPLYFNLKMNLSKLNLNFIQKKNGIKKFFTLPNTAVENNALIRILSCAFPSVELLTHFSCIKKIERLLRHAKFQTPSPASLALACLWAKSSPLFNARKSFSVNKQLTLRLFHPHQPQALERTPYIRKKSTW